MVLQINWNHLEYPSLEDKINFFTLYILKRYSQKRYVVYDRV